MGNGEFILPLKITRSPNERDLYPERNVTVHALPEVLDKYINQRLVHFATIDLGGFEYTILEELFDNLGNLSRQGVVFCQIEAELHQLKEEHPSALKRLVERVVKQESDYLPINHSPYMKIHHKVTFINFGNRECRRAFDLQRLFSSI